MKPVNIVRLLWGKRLLKTCVIALVLVMLSIGLSGAWWNFGSSKNETRSVRESTLPQGDAITDPTSILRYSLPIENQPVRKFQRSIEELSFYLRGRRWSPVVRDVKEASRVLNAQTADLLAGIPDERKPQAQTLISQMQDTLAQLRTAVEDKDKEQVWMKRRELLNQLDELEAMMVQGFPFEVPQEYANLPHLKGRATVEVETTQGTLTLVVDGYSAPITAGNFVDLVERGFYDGLEFIRADDLVVQTGDPPGEADGFIDPETGEYRTIPLEVLVRGDRQPTYGVTLEEAGRYQDDPILPFAANGAVALARPSLDPNGGSSQFFFFKFDKELTPPGFNLMDGRYAVFGYVVEGDEILDDLAVGDKILSARVAKGSENLVRPQVAQVRE